MLSPNFVQEDGELYCPDCNSYFSREELRKRDEVALGNVECDRCSAVLTVDEICFCKG